MIQPSRLAAPMLEALSTSAAPTAVVAAGQLQWANPACATLFGAHLHDLAGHAVERFVLAEETAAVAESLRSASGGESVESVHRVVRPDGEVRWVSAVMTPLRGLDTGSGVLLQLADLTAERHAQRELRHAATHDALTGLPNRLLFTEHLDQELRRLRRHPNSGVAVLFIDLDRFKHVNDTYGHAAGDELLVSVARRLRAAVRPQDVVSRLAGDEFAVLLEDVCAGEVARDIARRCLAAIGATHPVQGKQLAMSASIGITMTSGEECSAEEILAAADAAMYRAKDNGRGRAEYLTGPVTHQTPRAVLERELAHALERRQLEVHYQPIVDLRTRTVCAAEALLRWRHPTRGLMTAATFVPLAEDAGLIPGIGDWVTDVVCADLHRWDSTGFVLGCVYVNVSAQQVSRSLVDNVAACLERHDVDAARLRLEITESELMSASATLEHLDALHRLGCSLVVDDFGTGYSSLSRLIDLPIDVVKIDRSFISGVGLDPRPTAVVSAAILLAHDLRQGVVAEGVETDEQRRWLLEAGCTYAQGFGIAPPVPASDLPFTASRY